MPLTPAQQRASRAWIEVADLIDLQLSPLGLAAIEALTPAPGETIVDIGCGTGQTLGQLAERVGPAGRVIGVDISAPFLAVAAARCRGLSQVSLIEADATHLDLPAGADAVYSRFGVMAFADPPAAFANLRRMLKPGGRISFTCWRSLAENELDHLPLRAAGLEDRLDATQFSLEDPDHIAALLGGAGFGDVEVRAFDAGVSCGDVEATLAVVTRVGALGRILRENPAWLADAMPKVRAALMARAGPEVQLGAATWLVTATTR